MPAGAAGCWWRPRSAAIAGRRRGRAPARRRRRRRRRRQRRRRRPAADPRRDRLRLRRRATASRSSSASSTTPSAASSSSTAARRTAARPTRSTPRRPGLGDARRRVRLGALERRLQPRRAGRPGDRDEQARGRLDRLRDGGRRVPLRDDHRGRTRSCPPARGCTGSRSWPPTSTRDGYADLAVGAAGQQDRAGSGAVQLAVRRAGRPAQHRRPRAHARRRLAVRAPAPGGRRRRGRRAGPDRGRAGHRDRRPCRVVPRRPGRTGRVRAARRRRRPPT